MMSLRVGRSWPVLLAFVIAGLWAGCAAKVQAPPEPPGTVRRAEEAFRLRDYERAIELYRTYADLVRRDPYVPRVLYKAALAQYELGRYEDVLATLDDLQSRYPDKRWVQVEALRGDAQRALGNPTAAIQAWDHAFSVARPADESKLRLRIATVARSLSDAELEEASQLVVSKPAREILAATIAQREQPEIPEPLPEFPATEATELAGVGTAAETAEAGTGAAASAEGEVPPPAGRAVEPLGDTRMLGVLVPGGAETDRGLLAAVQLAVGADRVVAETGSGDERHWASSLQALADDPRVAAVITPVVSDDLATRARARALPLVAVGPAEPGPYVVAAGLSRGEALGSLLDYAVFRARLRRFAVVYPDTFAGRQFLSRAQAEVSRRGGEIVGSDALAPDTRSITAGLLRRWRDRDNMQAILLSDNEATAASFARFLHNQMPDIPLLGVDDWSGLAASVPEVSGVVFTSLWSPDRAQHPFVGEFRQQVGRAPGALEISAYEAATWLDRVLEELPPGVARAEAWAALQRTYEFEGPSGTVEITGGRFVRRPVILQFTKGELHEVPGPVTTALVALVH